MCAILQTKMYGSVLNEEYYARNNSPTFNQFKARYHFYDADDRQYMIAAKNRQLFANTRFKNSRTPRGGREEPFFTNYGYAKLFVKLTEPTMSWFGHRAIGKELVLYERASGRSFVVILKSHEKSNVKRRTGTIWVKGLDKMTLTQLLGQ